jgi:predicted enzyme related to lactoylglutathione lyase
VAKATELGATVVMAPNDMSFGRGAMIIDPQGAAVGLGSVDQPDS